MISWGWFGISDFWKVRISDHSDYRIQENNSSECSKVENLPEKVYNELID